MDSRGSLSRSKSPQLGPYSGQSNRVDILINPIFKLNFNMIILLQSIGDQQNFELNRLSLQTSNRNLSPDILYYKLWNVGIIYTLVNLMI
jgi:hypothetical protein